MKKHIDKLCLHGDNIITLIKHFIKHKIKVLSLKKCQSSILERLVNNAGFTNVIVHIFN